MHRAITRREFDIVAAWSVDRLGRSLQDLVAFLGGLHGAGVDLYLDRQGLDTSTPAGKALFQMLGVFAEFERSIIQHRIAPGIARGREKGRPHEREGFRGAGKLAAEREAAVRASLSAGTGMRRAAPLVGTGNTTVARIAAEVRAGHATHLHRGAQPTRNFRELRVTQAVEVELKLVTFETRLATGR